MPGRFAMICLLAGVAACNASESQLPTMGGNPAATREQKAGGSLCLTLSSARTEVLLGEPLVLLATLTNCSESVQAVRDLLAPEYGMLAIWMRRPGQEKEALYQPAVRRDGRGKRTVELRPGTAIATTVPVYFARDGWNLREVGEYSFRATYALETTQQDSRPLRVRVKLPPDAKSTDAAREFMDSEAARYFFLEGGDARGRENLLSIVRRYPDTLSARYARVALAIDAAASNIAERKADACVALEEAIAGVTDWIGSLRGYRALLACLRDTGQQEKAERMLRQFVEHHPEASKVRGLRIE